MSSMTPTPDQHPPSPVFFAKPNRRQSPVDARLPTRLEAEPEPRHQGEEKNNDNSNTPSNQSLPPLPPQLRNPPTHAAIRGQFLLLPALLLLLPDRPAAIPIRHLHLPAPRLVRPRIRLETPAHRLNRELVEAPARREVGVLCKGVGEAGEDVFLGGCAAREVLAGGVFCCVVVGDVASGWWKGGRRGGVYERSQSPGVSPGVAGS